MEFLFFLTGLLIGGGVIYAASKRYYIKSGAYLEEAVIELKREIGMMKRHSDWLVSLLSENNLLDNKKEFSLPAKPVKENMLAGIKLEPQKAQPSNKKIYKVFGE